VSVAVNSTASYPEFQNRAYVTDHLSTISLAQPRIVRPSAGIAIGRWDQYQSMFWLMLPSARNKIRRPKVLLTSAIVFVVLKTIFTVKEFTETAVPTI
jgi:hypothetical protein